jgi:hypothetical protein
VARTNWRDRLELVAEVGLRGTAAGDMVWDVSSWDAGGWSGLEPEWVTLAGSEIEAMAVGRGRQSGLARNTAGTSSVGLVWRTSKGGRWSFRPESPIKVGSELRIRAIVDGRASIPVYRGTVRRVQDRFARDAFRLSAELIDRLADLGAVDLPESDTAAGLGDLTHERVLRILDLAAIDREYASMGTSFDDSGTVAHASSTFARNLLDEAMVTTESEAGADLLVDREGLITLRRSAWWKVAEGHAPNARWNVTRATWANVGTSRPHVFDVLAPGGFDTGSDLDDVRNHISAARGGGSAITLEDPDSILRYGMRTFQRFDLTCRDDPPVQAFAQFHLDELSERTERINALAAELDPARSSDDLERWVDVELGDRHEIEWDDGDGLARGIFHVHGIRWRVDPEHCRLELDLWAYAGFGLAPAPPGEAAWGAALWSSDRWS